MVMSAVSGPSRFSVGGAGLHLDSLDGRRSDADCQRHQGLAVMSRCAAIRFTERCLRIHQPFSDLLVILEGVDDSSA